MPAPVTQCLLQYMASELEIVVWGEEVPRYDASGNPINPQAATDPSVWPVVTCVMEPPGMRRTCTFTDAYDDAGSIRIQVWGTTKASVQTVYDDIEELWASASNWQSVIFNPAGNNANPFYVIQMLLQDYWIGQVEGERLSKSLLCFRGDLVYSPCQIHGAIATA